MYERFALVSESPDAKSVTSWPASTSPSARSETTSSIPPYPVGGTANHVGARIAIFSRSFICVHANSSLFDANVPRAVEGPEPRQPQTADPGRELEGKHG